MDWTACPIDDRWHYFKSGSVHVVPTGVVETGKRSARGNLNTGCTLSSPEVSWVVPGKRGVTLDEAETLMGLGKDDRVDGVLPPSYEMEDPLAVDVNAEDNWDLLAIPPSRVIDVGPLCLAFYQ